MPPIIRVEGLGKQYSIGSRQASYATLRESLSSFARSPMTGRARSAENVSPTIWALRDVSFNVERGEVLGIVGRNGAGKSTLLKVLSRITTPTEGSVGLWGRVSSLLEVGTGFHPELTGRDNIFLNGAILGMRRSEILRKFDEIVSFAEVETFVDTPVKHFSSGMYLRLAFAVAAYLEPEVLIVDEVLAVGDASFQKKCLGKLEQIGASGRTVVFVSHNIPAVIRLCSRAILLQNGKVVADGEPARITRQYLSSDSGSPTIRHWATEESAPGDKVARLHSIRICDENGDTVELVDVRDDFRIEVRYWRLESQSRPSVLLQLYDEAGVCLFQANDFTDRAWNERARMAGMVKSVCHIPANLLAEGRVFVTVGVGSYNPNVLHLLERDVIAFDIVDRSTGEAARGQYVGDWPGVMRPLLRWSVDMSTNTPDIETEPRPR